MEIKSLEKAVNNLIQSWLCASEGVSVYVKQRHKFDNAIKIALIERLFMMGFEDVKHLEHLSSITTNNSSNIIVVKTISTDYIYHPCEDYDVIGNKINGINIESDIHNLLTNVGQANSKHFNNAYLLFVVFPCTHTDRSWIPHLDKIKNVTNENLIGIDFRFTNNVPGVIYYGKLDNTEEGLIKTRDVLEQYRSLVLNSIHDDERQIFSKSEKPPVLKTKLYEILKNIHDELLRNQRVLLVSELQELFEKGVWNSYKNDYPNLSENDKDWVLESFRSNGSGAKRAQIYLNTINEKNRVHYRPFIDQISKHNLFVYIEEENIGLSFSDRKIKAFSINDSNTWNYEMFYSIRAELGEKRIAIPVKIKDSLLMKKYNEFIEIMEMKKVILKELVNTLNDLSEQKNNNKEDKSNDIDLKREAIKIQIDVITEEMKSLELKNNFLLK